MNETRKHEVSLKKITVGVSQGHSEKNGLNPTTLDYNERLEEIGYSKKDIHKILDDLEQKFQIIISGADREEIITKGDLVTAVYLQTR
jgi:hypothetical protein